MARQLSRGRGRTARPSAWLGLLVLTVAGFASGDSGAGWAQYGKDPAAAYKYGSIGVETNEGMPYWLWVALPRICPEHLPGPDGYLSLGFAWEEGAELPVGFSKNTRGLYTRVGINCALCHSATYRLSPEDRRHLVLGGPSSTLDAQGYLRFITRCASDPRFNADALLREMEYLTPLSPAEKLLYRHVLIPQTQKALLRLKEQSAWMEHNPDWGLGRVDPFNPVKYQTLSRPVDGTIGNSDMMPIWGLGRREGGALHLDGLNDSVREVVISSAIGNGASRASVNLGDLRKLENWLRELRPPGYPLPIDTALAESGRQVFSTHCARCHEPGQPRAGTLIPVTLDVAQEGEEFIATDPYRIRMWDAPSAETYNRYASGYDWKFERFRDVDGYLAVPLEAIWLRGPYLHNGSVPTLRDLLTPARERPTSFYRGHDVYDPVAVGFVSNVPAEGDRRFFLYRTRDERTGRVLPGNSNQGHEYGTQLSEPEKQQLLEFLKTL